MSSHTLNNPNSPTDINQAAKLGRAQIISHELRKILAEQGRPTPAAGGGGQRLARYHQDPRYKAILTEDCSLILATRLGGLVREHREFGTGWNLIELEIANRRTLAIHFRGEELELFEFIPGIWETWFGAHAGSDTTPFKVPLVPKSMADLERLRSAERQIF